MSNLDMDTQNCNIQSFSCILYGIIIKLRAFWWPTTRLECTFAQALMHKVCVLCACYSWRVFMYQLAGTQLGIARTLCQHTPTVEHVEGLCVKTVLFVNIRLCLLNFLCKILFDNWVLLLKNRIWYTVSLKTFWSDASLLSISWCQEYKIISLNFGIILHQIKTFCVVLAHLFLNGNIISNCWIKLDTLLTAQEHHTKLFVKGVLRFPPDMPYFQIYFHLFARYLHFYCHTFILFVLS